MENKWYDAVDYTPRLVCEVELPNGERHEAVFVCGDWETLQGEILYPVRFRPLRAIVVVGLYTMKGGVIGG